MILLKNYKKKVINWSKPNCSGLTLIELLIASTLGVFIVGIVFSLFLTSKLSLTETAQKSVINENARYAVSVLVRELRTVDFWGKIQSPSITLDSNLVPIGMDDCSGDAGGYDLNNSFLAFTAVTATVENCITDAAIGSDVIFIKRAASVLTPFAAMEAGKNYLMTNHLTGVLYNQVDASPPSDIVGGNVPGGEVREYLASAYYVRQVSGSPPALYRKRLSGNTWENPGQEIASGVERIQLQLGVDTNNDSTADLFVSSEDVTSWNNVVSTRLYLLVRSVNSDVNFTNNKSYQLGEAAFGGVAYQPNDNYHRLLVETSVSFRNRRLILNGGI